MPSSKPHLEWSKFARRGNIWKGTAIRHGIEWLQSNYKDDTIFAEVEKGIWQQCQKRSGRLDQWFGRAENEIELINEESERVEYNADIFNDDEVKLAF